MKKIKFSLVLVLIVHITSIAFGQKINITSGKWRGCLIRNDEIRIPFIFEIESNQSGIVMNIINAEDTIRVNNFSVIGDSVLITLPFLSIYVHVPSFITPIFTQAKPSEKGMAWSNFGLITILPDLSI